LTNTKNDKFLKRPGTTLKNKESSPKVGAAAKLFNLQKSAFMEKKKIYSRKSDNPENVNFKRNKSNSNAKPPILSSFKMRQYEECTPRIQI
jgi:hypothetical protein